MPEQLVTRVAGYWGLWILGFLLIEALLYKAFLFCRRNRHRCRVHQVCVFCGSLCLPPTGAVGTPLMGSQNHRTSRQAFLRGKESGWADQLLFHSSIQPPQHLTLGSCVPSLQNQASANLNRSVLSSSVNINSISSQEAPTILLSHPPPPPPSTPWNTAAAKLLEEPTGYWGLKCTGHYHWWPLSNGEMAEWWNWGCQCPMSILHSCTVTIFPNREKHTLSNGTLSSFIGVNQEQSLDSLRGPF